MNAIFSVSDIEGQFVCTMQTDSSGEAVSPELFYGTYTIQQVNGKDGYCLMEPVIVKIDGSGKDGFYEVEKTDFPEYEGIALSKMTVVEDEETGTYEKKPEEGAEFLIENETGTYREHLTTNEEGQAQTKQLDPGVYHITQLHGKDNYAMAPENTVTIEEGEKQIQRVTMVDENTPRKIRIQKYLEMGEKRIPEKDARFFVIDENNIDLSKIDFEKENLIEQLLREIPSDAIAETIVTNKDGMAAVLLNSIPSEHDFVILQVEGENGYAFMKPWFSKEHTYVEENLTKVYELEAVDCLEDWAQIQIHKQYESSAAGGVKSYVNEEAAEFQILSASGDMICKMVTDRNGMAVSPKLPFGTYTVVQIKGKEGFSFIDNTVIQLNQSDHHKVKKLELKNEANYVELILKKRSFETKQPLDGGIYDIFDENNQKITSVITGNNGERGCASARLPYGKYQLIEKVPAPDFKTSDPVEFEISYETVEYEDEIGKMVIVDEEEPVYGEIILRKTGEKLSGISNSETSEYAAEYERQFEYEELPLEGAEYGLYAREDIVLDDGSVLWAKDTKIDQKTTGKNGEIKFSRQMKDGTESTRFPVGMYYYKEINAPEGYVTDTREYEVVISGGYVKREEEEEEEQDRFAEEQEVPEKEEIKALTGAYVLCEGENLNPYLKNVENVDFTWKVPAKDEQLTDVSYDQDGSVVLWYDQDTAYINTRQYGQKVIFSPNSRKMFENCKLLKHVYFENISTEFVQDYSDMFANCSALEELDISLFQMGNARYVERMFYNCENLQHIFAMDWEKNEEQEEEMEEPDAIIVEPLTDFLLGTPYKLPCFVFSYHFKDGSTQPATVTKEDVILSEEIARPIGKQEVTFTFTEGSLFSKYVSATASVNVVGEECFSFEGEKDVICEFDTMNDFINYSLEILKTDEKNEPVRGAVLGLFAKEDIVDAKNRILCNKNQLITTSITGDHGRTVFEKLPGRHSFLNGQSMLYEVKEIKAPEGYYKTEDSLTFSEQDCGTEEKKVLENFPKLMNQPIPYVTLRKTWDDYEDRNKNRPQNLRIKVIFADKTEEVYMLSGEGNVWSIVTNIQKEKFTQEIEQIQVLEEEVENYRLVEGQYDPQSGVYELLNESLQTGAESITVQKTIDVNEMDWNIWQPTFSFILKGVTDEGEKLEETKTITFSKSEAQREADANNYLTKELVFEKLPPGTYTISECGGEAYYQIASIEGNRENQEIEGESIRLTLGNDKENNIASDEKTKVAFQNEARKGKIEIWKKDEKGNPLSNVCFVLYDRNGNEVQRAVTNQDGQASFEQVIIGEYKIREICTLPGKQLLKDEIPIKMPMVVSKNENIYQDEKSAIVVEDKVYVYDYGFEITNSTSLILPKTGANERIKIGLLCVIGILLIGVSFLFEKRKYSTIKENME